MIIPNLSIKRTAITLAATVVVMLLAAPVYAVTITSTSLDPATEGTAYSFQVTSSTPVGILIWGATGLPTSLSMDTSTGIISGTPATGDAGSSPYSVVIDLIDQGDMLNLGNATLSLTVSAAGGTTTTTPDLMLGGGSGCAISADLSNTWPLIAGGLVALLIFRRRRREAQ